MEKNDFLYQDDNANYHVSQQVQTKLHELGVKLLEWAGKSPDFIVIEHLCSMPRRFNPTTGPTRIRSDFMRISVKPMNLCRNSGNDPTSDP